MPARSFSSPRARSSYRIAPLFGVLAAASPAFAQESPPAPAPSVKILTLASAEKWAVDRSLQVQLARTQTDVASAQVDESLAPLLPQVSANGQFSYGNTRIVNGVATGGGGTSGISPANPFWSVGASGSQLLYDFGQTTGRYGASRKSLDAQRDTETATRLQALLDVRKTYFTARADRELVDVAKQNLNDQNTHLAQVQGFVTAGTQPQIALAQQKAAVANARVQLITAQNNFETAKAQLNQVMGVSGDTNYDLGDEKLQPLDGEEEPVETLVQKAVEARPELASLARTAEAQERTLRAVRGGYGPTIAASGSVNELSTTSTLDKGAFFWTVGVSATWPLFQGGLTNAQVHQAEAGLAGARTQREIEALQVRVDVTTAQLAVAAAKETIVSAEEAALNAREQRRLAEQRYATGVGSIIELVDAQVADNTAATQLVQARYQLSSARAQLLWALGRT